MLNLLAPHARTIAAAVAGGLAGTGTAAVVVPPEVPMPWWGYLLVGIVNATITALAAHAARRPRSG